MERGLLNNMPPSFKLGQAPWELNNKPQIYAAGKAPWELPQPTAQPALDTSFLGKNRVGPTGENLGSIKDSIGARIGNALTSSEQAFGQDIAGAASAILPESQTGISDIKKAADAHAKDVLDLTKLIEERKKEGLDTTHLETALQNTLKNAPPQWADLYPSLNKTALQVLGDAGGVALDIAAGGSLKGIKGFGLVKNVAQTAEEAQKARQAFNALSLSGKLADIGKDTLKTAAISGGIGYGYDVTQNAQNNKLDFTPGVGTALGVGIPAVIGATRAAKALTTAALPTVASNLSGVPKGAYDQMKTGGVTDQIGSTNRDTVFADARSQQKLFNTTIQDKFGAEKQKIIDQFDGVRIGMNQNEQAGLRKIGTEFGFIDQVPQNLNSMSAKESMDLLAEINNVDPIKEFDSPITKKYKLALSELKDSLKSKAISQFGGDGGIFDTVYKDYAAGKKVLKDVSSIIGKPGIRLSPVQETTAKNRLMSVFNEDKGAYLNAIKTLEEKTGSKIIDKVAAAHLSNILPKTLRGGPTGVIGLGSDLLGLATFPLSSPRIGSWIIQKVGGYSPTATEKLLNLSPKIRQTISDAVMKENMSFDAAVEKYTKHVSNYVQDYIQNPSLGLSVKDVSNVRLTDELKNSISKELANYDTKPLRVRTMGGQPYALADGPNDMRIEELQKKIESKSLNDQEYKEAYGLLHSKGIDAMPTDKPVSKFKQNPVTGKMEGSKSLSNPTVGQTAVKPYVDKGDLTTKILSRLEGKTTVAKQYIADLTNGADIKQVEKDVIREALKTEGDKVNVGTFADKVKAELLPLKITNSRGGSPLYEQITLPGNLRGDVSDYEEHVFESPIKTSAGDVHFGANHMVNGSGEGVDNYFGHTRIEDMADNKTRRVIEVQSDLYQKGNLEKEGLGYKNVEEYNKDYPDQNFGKADRQKIADMQKLQQYNDPTAHFRMVREEIKKAAQDGKTKLQFPTGETAMKIEGLGDSSAWADISNHTEGDEALIASPSDTLSPNDLKVGQRVARVDEGYGSFNPDDSWIITDVLGDGKFKAYPKSHEANRIPENWKIKQHEIDGRTVTRADNPETGQSNIFENKAQAEDWIKTKINERWTETFDISGKVDTNNPIYKFYEKEMGRYLKNNYKAQLVTDGNGVNWYEVNIDKGMKNMPVNAFGKINTKTLLAGAAVTAGAAAGSALIKRNQKK